MLFNKLGYLIFAIRSNYKTMKESTIFKVFFWTLLTITLLVTEGCGTDVNEARSRPSILILMSDNHSWNHLGCYGDPVLQTPNIDKLSETGIRFTNA